jgi:hypothetical protein
MGNMGKGVGSSVEEGNMVGMGGGDMFASRSTPSVSVPPASRIECREEGIASCVVQHRSGGAKDYKRLG